jgi:organic radical activating enzyme
MEEFYSIQGEGMNTGSAAYFVRIGGCDIGCHWCDEKESWNPAIHPLTPVEEIVSHIISCKAKAVVVTGGEPLLYNLDPLCKGVRKSGVKTFLETSGAYPLSGVWDWICLSPKKKRNPLHELYNKANELKVIISDISDFEWAEECASKAKENCNLLLQPEWSRRTNIIPIITDYIMQHPEWRISLQSHKYIGIP